jgi:hypothetical protein
MERAAGYSESQQLTGLIERLRERLIAHPAPQARLGRQLEAVLERLLVRNQRLRVLHRMARVGGFNEHARTMRDGLETLDAQLLQELPSLLELLHA